MLRRTFLQTLGAGVLAAQARRLGIKLGIDAYSIRAFEWKALRLIDYVADLKLDSIQMSYPSDYDSDDPAYLAKVKDHATRRGISIDGAIGCICSSASGWRPANGTPEAYLRKGMRVTKAVGGTCMRVFIGGPVDRRGPVAIETHIENTIRTLRAVRNESLDLGVKVAIENHGDISARETLGLIETAGKDYVAACLDTGNPMWLMEDPMLTLEVLGPYTVTTHIRDSAVFEHPRGAAFQWVALGDGSVDFAKLLALFQQVCPKSAVQLEIITGRPPQLLPYLEAEYWKVFSKLPAADFARFERLAKSGRPYQGPMLITGTGKQPPEYEAALKEQQRVDLERSLVVARSLGVGLQHS